MQDDLIDAYYVCIKKKRMYDIYENRKSSYNQKQHLFLEQRSIIGYKMWMWLSSFIIKEDTGIVQ